MPPVISVSALRKTYKSGLVALDGIDLAIEQQEIFALLGPNGAGKTTLISIICGTVGMSSGQVLVNGHDIPGLPSGARLDRAGAAGNLSRYLRHGLEHGQFQPRALRPSAGSGLYRAPAARSFAMGQARSPGDRALRRHEAPPDDRQGPQPRAQTSCSWTNRRPAWTSISGATCGHWFAACGTRG